MCRRVIVVCRSAHAHASLIHMTWNDASADNDNITVRMLMMTILLLMILMMILLMLMILLMSLILLMKMMLVFRQRG